MAEAEPAEENGRKRKASRRSPRRPLRRLRSRAHPLAPRRRRPRRPPTTRSNRVRGFLCDRHRLACFSHVYRIPAYPPLLFLCPFHRYRQTMLRSSNDNVTSTLLCVLLYVSCSLACYKYKFMKSFHPCAIPRSDDRPGIQPAG
ncbi:uncharacterized protein SCHCODRAFT_02064003 [Schizophyllum commune H4-8]|uniref:uncharacterized protein n=1 Tax=Schizophyllum commune (strain H4-8 / FGSC 9210) TaxID=578458 RepID=UPI00215E2DB9|nr:uncharacterized protein SCHCODRAFT_02064003 [Schizophyllum commune H4-8]KAI5888842.1 hypothetical protein SCHCODRAFT_02064003 [Schizophyllum commune H4-8]